ncbi:MAG: cysteine desulfurase family protein [Clostridia bacterium]
MNDIIYLDNAATTQPYPEVIELMMDIQANEFGNSSSMHRKGVAAGRIIKESTETIAGILGCAPDEIVFTSGGAESNNMAIKGCALKKRRSGNVIVTTAFEHPTVLNTVKNLTDFNINGAICGIDNSGGIRESELLGLINPSVILVSAMTVNSETGAYTDMGVLSEKIKSINEGTIVHTDAVQAFCKLPLNLKSWNHVDMLSISSHKVHGPKGVGALFIRKGTPVSPLIDGGGPHAGIRAGTENTAGIAGFALASLLFSKNLSKNHIHASELKSYLIGILKRRIDSFVINSPGNSSPYILSVAFSGIKSEVLLNHLSGKEIYVSAGSACSSKKKSNSHVLEAMHVPDEFISGALRISLSPQNTKSEIDIMADELCSIIPFLRKTVKK